MRSSRLIAVILAVIWILLATVPLFCQVDADGVSEIGVGDDNSSTTATVANQDPQPQSTAGVLDAQTVIKSTEAPKIETTSRADTGRKTKPRSSNRRGGSAGLSTKPVIEDKTAAKPVVIPNVSIKEKPSIDNSLSLSNTLSNRPDKIASMSVAEKEPSSNGSQITAKTLLSTFMALILVVALAYGTLLFVKWASGQRGTIKSGAGGMRVLESVRLSQAGTMHIVEVKGKRLLIGAATGQITLLQELEPDGDDESELENGEKFQEYLERYSNRTANETPAGRIGNFLRDVSQQLRQKHQQRSSSKSDGDGNH